MKEIGYIRASKSNIDTENQRTKIQEYATKEGLDIDFVIDVISSSKELEKRKISKMINEMKYGQTFIVAELSRIARNTEQALSIARRVVEKNGKIISLNPSLTIGGNEIAQKVMLVVLALTAEIEGYFIRSRTRIALQEKKRLIKENGFFINKRGEKCFSLGAKKGAYQKLKLEDKAELVLKYKTIKLSNRAISKLLEVSPITVARFLKHYPVKNGKYLKIPPEMAKKLK
ncbi:recombinase family protein [Candidatus Pacearchaeota archaeon]|nr:recombinase family protein [Candidatus Pacearchaeota archaeon]